MKLCSLTDLDKTGSYGVSDGQEFCQYFVVLLDGVPKAYRNRCPHLGIPLEVREHEFLDHDRDFIVCANHGALFRLSDGECVAGPCRGQALQSVPVIVSDGDVWLQ